MRQFITLTLFLLLNVQGFCIQDSASIYIVKFEGKSSLRVAVWQPVSKIGYYTANCFAKPVTELSMKAKIELIESLLNYEYDTTICNHPPFKLHSLSTQIEKPQTKYYTLQIDALILINLIAFGDRVFTYSAYPVLFDIQQESEENNNQERVSQAYKVYREWYKKCLEDGFASYTYPELAKVGLSWFGVKVSKECFSNLGAYWRSYYDCPDYKE